MKRNDRRLIPRSNQRQQMHRDVAKINVQQLRFGFGKEPSQRFELKPRDLPGRVQELSEPKPSQEMRRGFTHGVNAIERELVRVFAFLRDHDRSYTLERRDLPVDVQHLRL